MPSLEQIIGDVCRRMDVEPFWVGGTVRDRILGKPSHDWDFVCHRAERAARGVARRLGATCITLDEHFKIYRVVPRAGGEASAGLTLDFAERQGKTLRDDLARRDFTFNAIAAPLDFSRLIDPFDGQKDLKRRVLRAVSRTAFADDPLRLLRAYRLAAQLSLKIEARTERWLNADSALLEERRGGVARERVREELLRLFSQPRCAPALQAMDRSGLLTALIPDLEAGRRVGLDYYGRGGVITHHLETVANVEWILDEIEHPKKLKFLSDEPYFSKLADYVGAPIGGFPRFAFLKLAALVHDVGKPATAQRIRGRLRFFGHEEVGARMAQKRLGALRFSRQETVLASAWVRHHMRPGSLANAPQMTEKAMARFFRDLGEDGVGMLIVSLGDHYTYLPASAWGKGRDPVEAAVKRLLRAYYVHRERVLPPKIIDGHRLMKELKLKPGRLIGALLDAVRDAQAEGKVTSVKDAIAWARKVARRKTAI